MLPHRLSKSILTVCAIAFVLSSALRGSLQAQTTSIPEVIEWTWEVRPSTTDQKLPNVLLLGDSITRNYFPKVMQDLTGVANVYLMAVSTSVGDPRLAHQIDQFAAMEGVHFQVVHFNNGMHGWSYSEKQYKTAFPSYLQTVAKIAGRSGTLIWTSTTPVLPTAHGATNPRIDARNAIADSFVRAEGIAVDDQHALMMKHQGLHADPVHFNKVGSDLQGDQAAKYIRAALSRAR